MTTNPPLTSLPVKILESRKRFLALLVLLLYLALLVSISVILVRRYSSPAVSTLDPLAKGTNALFELSQSTRSQYLLLVTPQGWQNTRIRIEAGKKISFRADGRVNMDGGGLFRTMTNRKNVEDLKRKLFHLEETSSEANQTPEYYLTDEEKKQMMLRRPWIDPDGLAPNTTDERMVSLTYGNRMERLELKGANLGSLVGRIGDSSTSDQIFKIGKKQEMNAQVSGDLWLNVNDVKNLQDLPQQMFFQDNLGFFWVVVTIE